MPRHLKFFGILGALLTAGRMCHIRVLWEGDTLPLAAAAQMVRGRVLYRDVWFDKPPLVAAFHMLCGGADGWALRLLGTFYALLCCWIAFRFASRLWSEREGLWAAGLLGFFLTFDIPSAVIPVASDAMMLAPHLAAVWLAVERRPYWSGVLAGVAFAVSPKAVFVGLVCALWFPAGIPLMAAGFASACAAAGAWLWGTGAFGAYVDEVWRWGRLYAGSSPVDAPWRNALVRTVNWLGFHVAIVVAATRFLWSERERWRWIAWTAIALVGVAMGMRFFPRYYFLLLPAMVLMAARGFALLGKRRELVALLLLIPLTRFGPSFVAAAMDLTWRDIRMDQASREAAAEIRRVANPGDTLLVWGYRPEIFVYSGLPAGTIYLDSQPLTGVPADRHLTSAEPVETAEAARRRVELTRSHPAIVADGLGLYNSRLAITAYPDLHAWLQEYREVARVGQTVIYRRR